MVPVASIVLPRTMGFAHARASFLFLIVLAVGACAHLDRRPAVAVDDTDRASVAGISEARFLPSDTAAMATFGRRLHERESKYFSSLGRPIPPESLLAISGGGDNGAFGAGVLVGWSEAARGHPSRSSPASAQAHSLRHLPLSAVSTIPCWRTCTRRLTRRIFSRNAQSC